ncbi:MAG: DMT family transporter [Actinomycetota bacterium]|nr:DMT family transporter [Actinomycetota bacterium]
MTRRGWLLFAAMCVIWGVPYLLIKVAVGELAPSTLVLARTGLAALLLLPIALAGGHVRPVLARWRVLLLFTAVEICMPWLLLGYAEQRLSSSLTGLLIAGVPMVSAVLAVFGARGERLGGRRMLGLIVGIAGVAALVGFEIGVRDARAVVALAVVVVAYAFGAMILGRGLGDLPGVGVTAVSLAIAAVAFLPAGLRQAPRHWPSAAVLGAVAVLSVLCTAIAFLVFFELVGEVGPARSTVITYINPAVAVLLGVLILHERFTAIIAAGFALVLAGSVLATLRPRAAEPVPEPVPVTAAG